MARRHRKSPMPDRQQIDPLSRRSSTVALPSDRPHVCNFLVIRERHRAHFSSSHHQNASLFSSGCGLIVAGARDAVCAGRQPRSGLSPGRLSTGDRPVDAVARRGTHRRPSKCSCHQQRARHAPGAAGGRKLDGVSFGWQMHLPEQPIGRPELLSARLPPGEGIVAHHAGTTGSRCRSSCCPKRAPKAGRGGGASGRHLVGGQPDVRAGRRRASR